MINTYVFGKAGFASMFANLLNYLILRFVPGRSQHLLVFVLAGFTLAFAQLHKMLYKYGENGLDMPMNLMFNYCRVTSLACCIHDGVTIKKARQAGKEPDLKKREKAFAIEEMPSFLDFMSYVYFCGGAISGPWYEYKDFIQMIRSEGHYKNVPSTLIPALTRYVNAWMCVGAGLCLALVGFDEDNLMEPFFLENPSLFYKFGYLWGALKCIMSTYLVGFCFMEVGAIGSGLGYNGNDENGNPKFDRVLSCNIYKLETSYKVKDFLANWNISTHQWLKYYVYLRMLPNNKRAAINASAALATFTVSAIWHGFYPGFFVFFIGAGLLDYHGKVAERTLGPLSEKIGVPGALQFVICYIWCYAGCAYFMAAFVLLSFEKFHTVYSSMNYIWHFVVIASIIVLIPFQPKREKSTSAAADAKKA